jgi:uncharacterized surface protein with fasciclin (FAS1) repeats
MKNKYSILTLVILSLLWLGGCDSEPEIIKGDSPNRTVLDIIEANGYTQFVKAVNIVGLQTEINAATKQTIFAPNNAAFSVLLQQLGLNKVEEIDPAVLLPILRYHISTEDTYASAALPKKLESVEGKPLYITKTATSVNALGTIVLKDRSGNNGTFHGINLVLSPPTLSIYDAISARATATTPEFTLLKYAIDKAGLDAALKTGDFTLFAPTDAAFASFGLGTTGAIDALSVDELKTALQYHVLPSAIFSIELVTGRVATVNGTLTNNTKGMDINATTPAFEAGAISEVNQLATNGVWHQVSAFATPKIGIKEGTTIPGLNIWSPNDAIGPDAFGALITAAGYSRFDDINRTTKDAIYFPRTPPAAGTFASNDDIIKYLERHIFASTVNITTSANGTKITSIGGNEYYVAVSATGQRFVNGVTTSRNAFGSTSTTNRTVYDGTLYIWGSSAAFTGLIPLPTNTIVEQLEGDANFTFIAAAIKKVGREASLSAGNKTFFAIDNATFTSETGLTSVNEIEGLDSTDDEDLISFLQEAIDRQTVNSVQFDITLTTSIPTLKNVLDEDVILGKVGGNLVIIEDVQDPENNFASFITKDKFLAKNGVIHIIDKFLEL